MTTPPKQPTVTEQGLFHPNHGLEGGKITRIKLKWGSKTHFFNAGPLTYTLTQQSLELEKTINTQISKFIWPHLLATRCRLVLEAIVGLIDQNVEFMEVCFSITSVLLQALGILLRGFRFFIHWVVLFSMHCYGCSSEALIQELYKRSFDIADDLLWLVSACIPSNYIVLTCGLKLLECILNALNILVENSTTKNKTCTNILITTEVCLLAKEKEGRSKLILNFGVNTLTTMLFVVQKVILPSISLALIVDPFVFFIFAAISLCITLVNRYLNQRIANLEARTISESFSNKNLLFNF